MKHLSYAAIAACLLSNTACGGGDSWLPPAETTASAATVRLRGCVVEGWLTPRAGVSVSARTTDGRLLDRSSSDRDGIFTLRLPARQTIALGLDTGGAEPVLMTVGSSDGWLGGCLRESGPAHDYQG